MNNNLVCLILRLSAFSVLFGRGLQHVFWDAPFRIIFWDRNIITPILNYFNITYTEFVSSLQTDFIIQSIIKGYGVCFLVVSFIALFVKKQNKKLGLSLIFGSILLVLLSLLYYKAKFLAIGQFIEYSCQMFSPVLLYLFLFDKIKSQKNLKLMLKIVIALTFIGHGLYAIGFYKTPSSFLNMTYNCFKAIGISLSNNQIINFLKIAGILDFVIAIALFLPKNILKFSPIKLLKPLLIWAIVWGFFTSLARIFSALYLDLSFHTFAQWLPQTILRLSHCLIPFALYLILYKRNDNLISSKNKVESQQKMINVMS